MIIFQIIQGGPDDIFSKFKTLWGSPSYIFIQNMAERITQLVSKTIPTAQFKQIKISWYSLEVNNIYKK